MRTRTMCAVLLALAGCGTSVSGTVQDKRESRNGMGLLVRELCIGDSRESCAWHVLRGKYAAGWYGRCDIGERYPDCRALIRI